MLATSVGRLRMVGMLEGISFLLLLGVAMPLKYFAGMPMAVSVVGMIHGVLFLAFCAVLYIAHDEKKWPLRWTMMIFIAALLPFGPFVIDRRLKEQEA